MVYWRNTNPFATVFAILIGLATGICGARLLDQSGLTAESIIWKLLAAFGFLLLLGTIIYSVKKFFSDF